MARYTRAIEKSGEALGRRAFGLDECAASLGVSRDTLDRASKAGVLRTVRVISRLLVPAEELDRILAEGLQIRRRGRPRKMKPDAGSNGGVAADVEAGQ